MADTKNNNLNNLLDELKGAVDLVALSMLLPNPPKNQKKKPTFLDEPWLKDDWVTSQKRGVSEVLDRQIRAGFHPIAEEKYVKQLQDFTSPVDRIAQEFSESEREDEETAAVNSKSVVRKGFHAFIKDQGLVNLMATYGNSMGSAVSCVKYVTKGNVCTYMISQNGRGLLIASCDHNDRAATAREPRTAVDRTTWTWDFLDRNWSIGFGGKDPHMGPDLDKSLITICQDPDVTIVNLDTSLITKSHRSALVVHTDGLSERALGSDEHAVTAFIRLVMNPQPVKVNVSLTDTAVALFDQRTRIMLRNGDEPIKTTRKAVSANWTPLQLQTYLTNLFPKFGEFFPSWAEQAERNRITSEVGRCQRLGNIALKSGNPNPDKASLRRCTAEINVTKAIVERCTAAERQARLKLAEKFIEAIKLRERICLNLIPEASKPENKSARVRWEKNAKAIEHLIGEAASFDIQLTHKNDESDEEEQEPAKSDEEEQEPASTQEPPACCGIVCDQPITTKPTSPAKDCSNQAVVCV